VADKKAEMIRTLFAAEASLPALTSNRAVGFEDIAMRSRRRDRLEFAVGYGLIMLVIWAPRTWQHVLYWTPVAWIAATSALSWQGYAAAGLRATNFLRSFWIVGVAASFAGLAVALAVHLGTLHSPAGLALFFRSYIGYIIWSLVQQFLMAVYFLARLMRLMTGRVAVLAAACIFAVAHLPNPVLTPLTLLWGFAACVLFLRYRNLWTLGLAHAIFGITVAVTLPVDVTHSMRVGLGYVRYHPRPLGPRQSELPRIKSLEFSRLESNTF
jgi:membrane protease YdiL (CAAX protease family)